MRNALVICAVLFSPSALAGTVNVCASGDAPAPFDTAECTDIGTATSIMQLNVSSVDTLVTDVLATFPTAVSSSLTAVTSTAGTDVISYGYARFSDGSGSLFCCKYTPTQQPTFLDAYHISTTDGTDTVMLSETGSSRELSELSTSWWPLLVDVNARGAKDIIAGSGRDTVLYHESISGGDGDDDIFGNGGNLDIISGDEGNDVIFLGPGSINTNEAHGGPDNDLIFGSPMGDLLFGDGGNDAIRGNGGIDDIFGGDGSDALCDQDNGDLIDGGVGTGDQVNFIYYTATSLNSSSSAGEPGLAHFCDMGSYTLANCAMSLPVTVYCPF